MKISVLQPVQHDGTALAVGSVADIDEAAARALIASGAAEAVPETKPEHRPELKRKG